MFSQETTYLSSK
uniref:Uncharacterized protein n=1 Tax=Anguilla anguilla TaxID=7936 RepID=A0A0E9TS40_ANGAN